jgi:predicted ATPase
MTTKFIIGLSGTHGTGKSTILNGVEAAGFNVDRTQLSRQAQAALGWDTLARAQDSVENMWALQNTILAALNNRDYLIEFEKRLTMVERSPADLWAYTRMWCERLGVNWLTDERTREYYAKCKLWAERYDIVLFVRQHPNVPFVAEPNRADRESRDYVEYGIEDFLVSEKIPRYTFWSTDADERIEAAINFMTPIESPVKKENS